MAQRHKGHQPKGNFESTCGRCGKPYRSNMVQDGRKGFCPECFRDYLRQRERRILEDYCSFGIWAREASVRLFAERFAGTDALRDRGLLALKVFEEMMLATEDLCILYYALRNHRESPVVYTLLTFESQKEAQAWQDELRSSTPNEILARMGLVISGAPRFVPPGADVESTMGMLTNAVEGLREAAYLRNAEDAVLVQALNKLKHGFMAVSADYWHMGSSRASNGGAFILYANRESGRLQFREVEASAETVSRMAEMTISYAHLATVLIQCFLGATASHSATPS